MAFEKRRLSLHTLGGAPVESGNIWRYTVRPTVSELRGAGPGDYKWDHWLNTDVHANANVDSLVGVSILSADYFTHGDDGPTRMTTDDLIFILGSEVFGTGADSSTRYLVKSGQTGATVTKANFAASALKATKENEVNYQMRLYAIDRTVNGNITLKAVNSGFTTTTDGSTGT